MPLLPKGWDYRSSHLFLFCAGGLNPGFHACWVSNPVCHIPSDLLHTETRPFPSGDFTAIWAQPSKAGTSSISQGEGRALRLRDTPGMSRVIWLAVRTWSPEPQFEFCYLRTKFLSFQHTSQITPEAQGDKFDTPGFRPSRFESESWLPYVVVRPQATVWPPLASFLHLFNTLSIK